MKEHEKYIKLHKRIKELENELAISKAQLNEAGQLVIRQSQTCINDVLRELFITFDKNRIYENKKAVELRLVIPENMGHLCISTDPFRVKQVLSNLVGNALKFTETGFIEFGYTIGHNEIEFYVKDTGIGIPKDKFKLIFERFGPVMENERLNGKETGLGLLISINIVKLLGGKMWLESEVGKGSKFCFNLPIRSDELAYEEVKPALPVRNKFEWIGKKLLVVDDDQINWIYLRELISPTKAQLTWAKNGKEAVDIYQKDSTFDMILMDFRMPVMNGFDATKVIRGYNQRIPIIALTAYAQEEEKELFLQAGCNAFLNKPVQNGQLFKMLNHFLIN